MYYIIKYFIVFKSEYIFHKEFDLDFRKPHMLHLISFQVQARHLDSQLTVMENKQYVKWQLVILHK